MTSDNELLIAILKGVLDAWALEFSALTGIGVRMQTSETSARLGKLRKKREAVKTLINVLEESK